MERTRTENVEFAASSLHQSSDGCIWARLLNGKVYRFAPDSKQVEKPLGNQRTSDIAWNFDSATLLMHNGQVLEFDLISHAKSTILREPNMFAPISREDSANNFYCVLGESLQYVDRRGNCIRAWRLDFEPEILFLCSNNTLVIAGDSTSLLTAESPDKLQALEGLARGRVTSVAEHPSSDVIAVTGQELHLIDRQGNGIARCEEAFNKSGFSVSGNRIYCSSYSEEVFPKDLNSSESLGDFFLVRMPYCSSFLACQKDHSDALWVSHDSHLLLYE